tara:strand:- start:513 stop:860 length:348 start_codon:yes stop_codon:yes gene_type:complete
MDCEALTPCVNTGKECMCFTYSNSTDPEKDQFCGYISAGGGIVACQPGCCNGGMGCPGQCREAPPKRPDGVQEVGDAPIVTSVLSEKERMVSFENLFKILLLLLLMSTVSLFIRG